MKNPRIGIKDAIRMAMACGIPVRRQKDGHYLFYIGDNRIVSASDGRNELIPPRLAVAIRRKHAQGRDTNRSVDGRNALHG